MNEEDYFKIIEMTQQKLRRDEERADRLAEGPMSNLVQDTLAAIVKPEHNWLARARPPACADDIAEAEKPLACTIPAEIREFYSVCDGFEALTDSFPDAPCSMDSLVTGAALSPPLSTWIRQHQQADPYREAGEPLPLFPHDDLGALAADEPVIAVSLDQTDELIALASTADYRRVSFLTAPLGSYQPGTILEIERCVATIYPGIRRWLSARMVMFGSD